MELSKCLVEHWHTVCAANALLMQQFEDYLRSVCPTLKVMLEDTEYKIAVNFMWVQQCEEGYYIVVELHRDDEDGEVIEIPHHRLLSELLKITDY